MRRLPAALYGSARLFWHRAVAVILRGQFRRYGKRFRFDPFGRYTFETIEVGDYVDLGAGATLMASRSRIIIGNHVMFAPEVTIRGGNHRTDLVGRFMHDVREDEKRPSDDLGVEIEDDVWIGTRAIILHGVKIGRGAIVGAGAVVTKSVPPYAIVAGNPARVLRYRWDAETIQQHEAILYPVHQRLTLERLHELLPAQIPAPAR